MLWGDPWRHGMQPCAHCGMLPVNARRAVTDKKQLLDCIQAGVEAPEGHAATPGAGSPQHPQHHMLQHSQEATARNKRSLQGFSVCLIRPCLGRRGRQYITALCISSCLISIVNVCGIYSMSEFLHFFQGRGNRGLCIMLSMQNCVSQLSQVFPWKPSLSCSKNRDLGKPSIRLDRFRVDTLGLIYLSSKVNRHHPQGQEPNKQSRKI